MDISSVRENAHQKLSPSCRVCKECNGVVCAGEMPGLGGAGTGSSFKNNILALAKHKLNLRTLHTAKEPDTQFSFFAHLLSAPIMAAPMTAVGIQTNGKLGDVEWAESVVFGSRKSGIIPWTGDGPDPVHFQSGLDALWKSGTQGVPVVKPRENKAIFEYIKRVEEAEAIAIGIDIDAAGIINMKLRGQPVEPKGKNQLQEIINSTTLPVILKGIMTVDEAVLAEEVGAAGIVISNHGGRVLDHTPGTAEVLPEIASQVSGKMMVIVDGGVRSGVDILKMLALGADAVLIGRPLLIGAAGGGAEGVSLILNKYIAEMKGAMTLTGCTCLADISDKILR